MKLHFLVYFAGEFYHNAIVEGERQKDIQSNNPCSSAAKRVVPKRSISTPHFVNKSLSFMGCEVDNPESHIKTFSNQNCLQSNSKRIDYIPGVQEEDVNGGNLHFNFEDEDGMGCITCGEEKHDDVVKHSAMHPTKRNSAENSILKSYIELKAWTKATSPSFEQLEVY